MLAFAIGSVNPVIAEALGGVADSTRTNSASPSLTWNQPRAMSTFATSLPFAWVASPWNSVAMTTGISYTFGFDAAPDFGILVGADGGFTVGSGYEDTVLSSTTYFTAWLLRTSQSLVLGHGRYYGYGGVSECFPFPMFFGGASGLDGLYWQTHLGAGVRLTRSLDLGIKASKAISKFHAWNGQGYNNDVELILGLRL